jgi:CRP-like cAMP-binding protein
MSRNSDISAFQKSVAALPLATFRPNEIVLSAGSKTGRLLILKEGAVVIVEDGIEIAKVTEPGAVFGEVSALLDTPHTADVRALESSQFYVADANLLQDKAALRHVAAILARRLVDANEAFIELKRHLEVGKPRDVVNKAVEKIQELIGGI